MLGGAKVTLIVEDDQGKPDTAVTKANKLILSDKVHMLVGGVLATTGYALAPVATREKMLYIGSIATADDLGAARLRQVSLHGAADLRAVAAARIRSGNGPASRATSGSPPFAADYAFGHETAGGFQKAFEDCGGADRAENLAADRHQGLRALHPDYQVRHRRDLHADGGADVAAIP